MQSAGKRVLYLQYTNPANYPPLEHSALILLRADWRVNFFGIRSEGESSKLVLPEALAGTETLWRRARQGWQQKLHFSLYTLAAIWRAFREKGDWVYCSDFMTCPAALAIKLLGISRVIYHEHDSPTSGGTQAPPSRFQKALLRIRQGLARRCDLIILPNPERLRSVREQVATGQPTLCVFNCPMSAEANIARSDKTDGTLKLAFHGSINPERLPLALLKALALLGGKVHLQVIGYAPSGSRGYMNEFCAEAERLGAAPFVSLVGAVPSRAEMMRLAATADVGITFMPLHSDDINMQHMAGASNKPFDYLACGLAVLVSPLPEWEEMFVASGCGLSCDPGNPVAIEECLRWMLNHPQETQAMGARGRDRILNGWNYENQFAPVLAFMEATADGGWALRR